MTTIDLIEWVKRQLGYPTRNVELTDDQLNDCVSFALLEVQPWFSSYYYVTMDLDPNQSAIYMPDLFTPDRDGFVRTVHDVTDVIKIPNNLINASKGSTVDPFNSSYVVGGFGGGFMGIGAASGYYSTITNNNIHQIIGQYARQRNELFYSRLAQILWQRTMGSISPDLNFDFHRDDQYLYLGVGYPTTTTITIEYVPTLNDLSMIFDKRYIRCAQDLALGQALMLQARITGKYTIGNAPSQINYGDMRSDGDRLIRDAREELKRIHRGHVIID